MPASTNPLLTFAFWLRVLRTTFLIVLLALAIDLVALRIGPVWADIWLALKLNWYAEAPTPESRVEHLVRTRLAAAGSPMPVQVNVENTKDGRRILVVLPMKAFDDASRTQLPAHYEADLITRLVDLNCLMPDVKAISVTGDIEKTASIVPDGNV